MENEDNSKAIYCDPNAYIHFSTLKRESSKKVVFAEPYECLPSYYIDNNFKKHNCDCVRKHAPEKPYECKPQRNYFDFKNLLPILGLLSGGKSGDFSNLVSMLTQKGESETNNPLSMIASMLSNNGGLDNILNIFKPKGQKEKKPLKSTDFEIKNYTKVE